MSFHGGRQVLLGRQIVQRVQSILVYVASLGILVILDCGCYSFK